jgi:hypothetical protein
MSAVPPPGPGSLHLIDGSRAMLLLTSDSAGLGPAPETGVLVRVETQLKGDNGGPAAESFAHR